MEGQRFFDVSQVEHEGRALGSAIKPFPNVPSGHVLVAVLKKNTVVVAQDVTNPAEYDENFVAFSRVNWHSMDLYLITQDQASAFDLYRPRY
jgi:hypothetical protein